MDVTATSTGSTAIVSSACRRPAPADAAALRRRPQAARPQPATLPAAGGGGGGGRGGVPGVPYWGKYVFHDNNRDINLSQVSMRAITDWYFTAHPPIMHDLHESQPLLYTYSGAAPQNPNLDPILFAELPFFSNFELSQMTKWGMPGVYTHAFMDGWSPGYLGSVAYNHNGMMRMYETQAGNDIARLRPGASRDGRPATVRRTTVQPCVGYRRHAAAPAAAPAYSTGPAAGRTGGRGQTATRRRRLKARTRRTRARRRRRRRAGAPAAEGDQDAAALPRAGRTRRGGRPADRTRRWPAARVVSRTADSAGRARQLVAAQQRQLHADRRPVRPAAHGDVPEPGGRELLPEDPELHRIGKDRRPVRVRHSGAARRDARGRARQHPAGAGDRGRPRTGEIKISDGTFPAGSYVIKRDQPYGRLAKNLLERQSYPDPNLRTYDDSGWTMGLAMLTDVREIKDKAILDTPTTLVQKATAEGKVTGTGSAGLAIAHYGSNNMVAFRYKLRNVPMKITDRATTIDGVDVPAGSFVVTPPADLGAVRSAVQQFGLTAVALSALPRRPDARRPTCRAWRSIRRGPARRRSAGCGSRSTSSACRST